MLSSKHLQIIRETYDVRAPVYDQKGGFHSKQQADYLKWMDLKEGNDVLDLACGTGSLAISAKRIVGPRGRVVGVDISPASLEIAKSKVVSTGLDVEFFESDISAFQDAKKFDVITCSSAFVFQEDAATAVKFWAKLLKKGGKLIFDVPTKDSMLRGVLLEKAATGMNIPVASNRSPIDSLDKLKRLLTDAGLDPSESFDCENYEGPQELDASKSKQLFEEMVSPGNWTAGWYKELDKHDKRDVVKERFANELTKAAGEDGKAKSYLRFHMAVGRKL